MGTFQETLAEGNEGALHLGPERARVYSDLSPEDKDRYNADIRATNILLQGLPKDIYTLINHYIDAKDILDNVKMLLEGSKLTKEDRESQLYDDFEHFRQKKGETIHDYYVRFVIAVKLNRGLRDSNYDQLYAYLKQYKAHANENRMMLEQFTQPNVDPLALMFNVSHQRYYSQSSTTLPSIHLQPHFANNTQLDLELHQMQGTKPQFKMAGLLFRRFRVDRIEDMGTMQGVQVQLVMGELRTELGMQIQVKQGRLNVTTTTENGVALDEEQLLFIADNVFQAYDCDAFNFDVDEAPTAQTMFMENLLSTNPVYDETSPSYDSDTLSEVPDHDNYQDAICEHHEVHEMHDDVQPNYVVDSHADYTSDSNMIPYDQHVKDNAVPNNVVDNSLTAELATYKEQVELEPYSVKLQLTSTINHNKSMVEEVMSLKKDFKQKENKYLEEFLDMKALKEKNKVAIGYKNPLCLTCAQQVQPAVYNGHEIIKTNHAPAIVHNSGDTLEVVEITRKKMNDKMKDPECVKKKVKITPHDYSKENYLVTFTPQKQNESRSSQRADHRFKTNQSVDGRITPTGLTEGERGFEQTKECYLTEVIPFFKTLKEHFKGIQKDLTKEMKEMKEIFEELEVEVDQNVVNRKHDQIEFTEMHDVHTVVQNRCLELEAELSKLHDKVQKDYHTELVKCFSNLEVNQLNLQLKYQNLKERFGNNTSPPARDAPNFDSVFVIEKIKASIQGKDNITQLTEKVNALQEQNELFRAENVKIKQHYKELYDSIKIMHAKHIEQTIALLIGNENLKAQIHENLKCITMDSVKPRVLATGRYAIDVEPIPPRNTNNKEVVGILDLMRQSE
ncbi:hypothetical protein Tco_0388810 [Tanacetum coccineum]